MNLVEEEKEDTSEQCAYSPDGIHCEHWWEDEQTPCCYCGDNTPNPKQEEQ